MRCKRGLRFNERQWMCGWSVERCPMCRNAIMLCVALCRVVLTECCARDAFWTRAPWAGNNELAALP